MTGEQLVAAYSDARRRLADADRMCTEARIERAEALSELVRIGQALADRSIAPANPTTQEAV